MAVATKCPSCGRKVPVPDGFAGGAVTCPNADCAQVFQVQSQAQAQSPATRLTATDGAALRPRASNKSGARPELLDRIPTSFYASPAMFAVGLAVALLYGMVLFGVVSSRKNRPPEESLAARAEPTVAPLPPVGAEIPAPKPKDEPGKAETNTAEAGKAGAKTPTGPEPAKAKPAAPSPTTVARAETKTEPTKTSAAATTKSAPSPPPAPAPDPTAAVFWGPLKGVPGDTPFRAEGDSLGIAIPPTLHVLSPVLNTMNAPRLLTDARGDFTARVRVVGRISPGTVPLPKLPFTFQGAGLLVWQDDNNYLRLERTSSYSPEGKHHQIMVESCRDGRLSPIAVRDAREGDILLKLDRKAAEVRCSYSPDDGKTWLEVKRQSVGFPAEVQVGVSASNASTKPFAAKLEDFQLSGPGQ